MASIMITKTEQLKYREGFDVSVVMESDDGRKGYKTFFVPGKIEPTKETLQVKLDKFIEDFNTVPVEPKIYQQEEIDEILVQKKYFTQGQKFPDDLPGKPVSVVQ